MGRQIVRLVATCRTIEVARIGPAAAILRHAGTEMPYAFAADDMLLDAATSDLIIGDPTLETGGWLARTPDGRRLPTVSAVIGAERLDLDMAEAGILSAVLEAPLRVARLAGKMAVGAMAETGETPTGFLMEDEDGAYDAATCRDAEALLRLAGPRRSGPGAQVVLMGRPRKA